MTQKLTIVAFASAFTITSGIALAAGPNDAFNYPKAESHKNYTDQRIMDHNNAAPRYAATAKQTALQTAAARSPRYTVRSTDDWYPVITVEAS
jgi:hypothetical protein